MPKFSTHTRGYGRAKPLKRRTLELAQALLGRTSLPARYASQRSHGGAVILMYHSVCDRDAARWVDPHNHMDPRVFRTHAEFLASHCNVIGLSDLIDRIRNGDPIPPRTVVITFDDGYLDNTKIAFPILDELELPATLFLPTHYVDTAECQWIDRLYTSFTTRTADELTIDIDGDSATHRLDSHGACVSAYGALAGRLMSASLNERESLLWTVSEQLEPRMGMPRLTMNWDDVRDAVSRFALVEVGSHTVSHLDCSAHADRDVYGELQHSKSRIESEAQRRVSLFSFPYNRVSTRAFEMLDTLGYTCAVGGNGNILIGDDADCHTLTRLEAPASIGLLDLFTSGAYPELSVRLFGRA